MRLAIVIPAYNEEMTFLPTLVEVCRVTLSMGLTDGLFCLVDDGSTDNTWQMIQHYQSKAIMAIRLPKNRGHQTALLTGLLAVKGRCDAAITMDADGQHPPSAIPDFIAKFNEGADIVYGVRRRNPSLASRLFYRLMGDALVPNHGDFRLISARVLDTLNENSQPFLRGLFSPGPMLNQFAQMNLKTAIVYYDEQPRIAGKSTYTLSKRIALFANALKWRFRLWSRSA